MNNREKDSKVISYKYTFTLSNKNTKKFTVNFDKDNLKLILTERKELPDWVKLNHYKCPNCPLDSNNFHCCPAAVSLVDIIEFFKDFSSIEESDIKIETDSRTYFKHSPLAQGISSIVGVCMALSECPFLSKLRPMAIFHLPFSTSEETAFRAMSMYLLAQYFLSFHNKRPDWNLKNLSKIYEDIQVVNKSFSKRLCNIKISDAGINALIILDCFAKFVSFEINDNILGKIGKLYEAYFKTI
jgi:hypothetical protein